MKPRLKEQIVKGMSAVPTGRQMGKASNKEEVLFDFTGRACLAVIQVQFVWCHPLGLHVRDVCLHFQQWLVSI